MFDLLDNQPIVAVVAPNYCSCRSRFLASTRAFAPGVRVATPAAAPPTSTTETVGQTAQYAPEQLSEITLKLLPAPEAKATGAAYFRDLEASARSVSRIIERRILPATLELPGLSSDERD